MKTLCKILFLFVSVSCFSQQSKIDSLLSIIKKDKADTNKIIHLNDLSLEYINVSDYDSALNYSNSALKFAKQLDFKKGIAIAYYNIGIIYHNQGNYPNSLDYYLKALKIGEELKDKNRIAKCLGNIGIVYLYQGDYPKALNYYFKALNIDTAISDKNGMAKHLGCLGMVYYKQKDYNKALDYYLKALNISEELNIKRAIPTWLGNIGLLYYTQSDYPKALEYYFRASKMTKELGDKNGMATFLGNIGAVYSEQKKYKEAEEYLLKALVLSDSIGDLNLKMQFEEAISQVYEKMMNSSKALEHYKQYTIAKDSIFNEEKNKDMTRKEMNYEFEKKEAFAKAEQDKKDTITADEKRRQKIITYSVIVGLLLVALFAIFIFHSLRITKKQKQIIEIKNKETEKQKQIIEEKNKDITDSINYAKRIQQAKLPKREEINSAFPDSFVLFKPKDIVSGDFYYFHKNDKSIFIASADCTGHGVPGAFMSMIGSEKLDDALAHSADTSEILRHLNKGIKVSLHQTDSNESTRDGMDIALCSVDTDARVVKYAGANRPLWIIRNGQTVVEEIKATKKAIGGFTEDSQHFDTHVIQLQHGDTFYISTDGYADTFSGQGHKKLTTKKFKEILLSIQDKSLKEQEHHLDNFIEDWKGGTEQVDDILVIGVRL
ncbi:MAG: tetratricopeptide repeat protein [Bacteroidetes bacterium]|nr:tetratricopeptide repeat protein [Bacteroidota bacterium]